MSKKQRTDAETLGGALIIFGAIVSLFFGILFILNIGVGITFLPSIDFSGLLGALTSVLRGLALIILSLITLATSGTINISRLKIEKNWVVFLILGVLMYIFGGTLGGLLVIIGSLLLLF